MSKTSKLLSLVLRHKPEEIGITLDDQGWAPIDVLLRGMKGAGVAITRADLDAVVASCDKKRFTISENGRFIRAAQGHSVRVDLGLTAKRPPEILYHGTATANLDAIFATGLVPGRRNHVHLSLDPSTAQRVGQRHGKAVVLAVDTRKMVDDSCLFWRADNGVWLTLHVPSDCLGFATPD